MNTLYMLELCNTVQGPCGVLSGHTKGGWQLAEWNHHHTLCLKTW